MFILKRFFGMRDEKKIHKQEEIRLILVAVRVAVPPFRNPLTLEVTVYFRHFSTQNNEANVNFVALQNPLCFPSNNGTQRTGNLFKASKPSPEHVCFFYIRFKTNHVEMRGLHGLFESRISPSSYCRTHCSRSTT